MSFRVICLNFLCSSFKLNCKSFKPSSDRVFSWTRLILLMSIMLFFQSLKGSRSSAGASSDAAVFENDVFCRRFFRRVVDWLRGRDVLSTSPLGAKRPPWDAEGPGRAEELQEMPMEAGVALLPSPPTSVDGVERSTFDVAVGLVALGCFGGKLRSSFGNSDGASDGRIVNSSSACNASSRSKSSKLSDLSSHPSPSAKQLHGALLVLARYLARFISCLDCMSFCTCSARARTGCSAGRSCRARSTASSCSPSMVSLGVFGGLGDPGSASTPAGLGVPGSSSSSMPTDVGDAGRLGAPGFRGAGRISNSISSARHCLAWIDTSTALSSQGGGLRRSLRSGSAGRVGSPSAVAISASAAASSMDFHSWSI
mmetsp:Transcript_19794/g.55655  ORF Transcript_19794/g.55655 Transcript_19794/m.55655 type:complete len:369 (+) Transcript_19794:598-1704(+)